MKFNTKYHGEIQFEEKDIIYFKKGLPGFEYLNKFVLLPVKDNDLFSILHSIEDSEVGFVVTSPFEIIKEYELSLNDEVISELSIEKEEDVLVVNTVTLNSNIKDITINLKAPMIINIKNRLGEQIILDREDYLIKYPLFRE